MTSDELITELSGLSGLPRYRISAMLSHMGRVVAYECGRGGTVRLPLLGDFYPVKRKARTMTTLRNGAGVLPATTIPGRKTLGFRPFPAAKVLIPPAGP